MTGAILLMDGPVLTIPGTRDGMILGIPVGMIPGTPDGTVLGTMVGIALGAMDGEGPFTSVIGALLITAGITVGVGVTPIMNGHGMETYPITILIGAGAVHTLIAIALADMPVGTGPVWLPTAIITGLQVPPAMALHLAVPAAAHQV